MIGVYAPPIVRVCRSQTVSHHSQGVDVGGGDVDVNLALQLLLELGLEDRQVAPIDESVQYRLGVHRHLRVVVWLYLSVLVCSHRMTDVPLANASRTS